MAISSTLFGIPGLTLGATIQWLLTIKFLPDYYTAYGHLVPAVIFTANYVFGLFFWTTIYPVFISPMRHIPGPRSLLSAAHRHIIVKDGPSGNIFLNLADEYSSQDLINLQIFGSQFLVTNPRLFADLFVHRCYDFAKPSKIRTFLRHVLGDGLVIVEGAQHKFIRKNTMPAFHFRHIKNLYPMMWAKGQILTQVLKHEVETVSQLPTATGLNREDKDSAGIVELSSWTSKATLDIIGIAALGRKIDVLEKGEDRLSQIFEELLEPDPQKLLYSMLAFALGMRFVRLLPWKMNQKFTELTTSLADDARSMVADKREAIAKKGDDHFDVLSLLIKSDQFSDDMLKDQLLTFLAAGHETTASSLAWACFLMAKEPELQNRLREEVNSNLQIDPVTGQPIDLAGDLEQMPLLHGIIHETLRLYPTVPLTLREAVRDTRIGDHFIPKGIVLVVSFWQINRSPYFWGRNADECVPERWITDGKPNLHGGAESNYNFVTFLHGPRSCIGQNFAKAEMRCLLAAMVRSFTWELAMDERDVMPRGVITIKPEKGLYLKLKPIDQSGKGEKGH